MLVLDRDGSIVSYNQEEPPQRLRRGYAELPASSDRDFSGRIRRLVDLAFDQLGLRVLELHVRDAEFAAQPEAAASADDLDLFPAQFELEYGLDR